jgi:hypothetical protein
MYNIFSYKNIGKYHIHRIFRVRVRVRVRVRLGRVRVRVRVSIGMRKSARQIFWAKIYFFLIVRRADTLIFKMPRIPPSLNFKLILGHEKFWRTVFKIVEISIYLFIIKKTLK